MTKLLERAVEAARALPDDAQDAVARLLLTYLDDESFYDLTEEEEASLAVSLAQSERGEFVSDEQFAAIWAKYGA